MTEFSRTRVSFADWKFEPLMELTKPGTALTINIYHEFYIKKDYIYTLAHIYIRLIAFGP